MTISEKISLINNLYISSRLEEQRDGISINSAYLTINDNNEVGVWPLAANTVFNGNNLTICCMDKNYLSYGWKTYRTVYAVFDRDGNILNYIKLGRWCVNWGFIETSQSRSPIAQVQLFLETNSNDKITLLSYSSMGYQDVWNCLLEINQNCDSIKEAGLYFKFFESKFENKTLADDLQSYKQEIASKDGVITQYKELLNSIKSLLEK